MVGWGILIGIYVLFMFIGFAFCLLFNLGYMRFYVLSLIGLFVLIMLYRSKFKKLMRSYEKVTLGMTEAEMLKIMGKKYNKSSLKNNRTKYEWRYNNGVSSSYHGIRYYSGVSKVDIYLKDGIVEEIRPYNC